MSLWPQNASQMHCWPELPSTLGFLHRAWQPEHLWPEGGKHSKLSLCSSLEPDRYSQPSFRISNPEARERTWRKKSHRTTQFSSWFLVRSLFISESCFLRREFQKGNLYSPRPQTLFADVNTLALLPTSLPEKCKGQVPCTLTSRDLSTQALPVPMVLLFLSPCILCQGKSR